MSTIKNAVIAAAGLGSRLGLGMPKCMIAINKRPLLARMLDILANHVESIVVVTGYREELIMEYCQNHYRNIIIARNPNFATTNTGQSLAIGARFVSGKTIFLDGDLLIEPHSMEKFVRLAVDTELTLGITRSGTEHPVYVNCSEHRHNGVKLLVEGFSRDMVSPYEWANLFVGPSDIMDGSDGFVFEELAKWLPAAAGLLEVAEIDTQQDLLRAEDALIEWET